MPNVDDSRMFLADAVTFPVGVLGVFEKMRGLLRLGSHHRDVIYTVESERESDGRWLAEVMELPGVMAYGQTRDAAIRAAGALALRVLADRLEHEETPSDVHFHLEPLGER